MFLSISAEKYSRQRVSCNVLTKVNETIADQFLGSKEPQGCIREITASSDPFIPMLVDASISVLARIGPRRR